MESWNGVNSSISSSSPSFAYILGKLAAFPAILKSSTYADKNSCSFRWTKRHSHPWTFSNPSFMIFFVECNSHRRPARGCPYKFSLKRQYGSLNFSQLLSLGHLCLGNLIQVSMLKHSFISANTTWWYAPIASESPPALPGKRANASNSFAAAWCEAEVPCSVKTAKVFSSSLTWSPRRTTRPLYLRSASASSLCFTWHSSIRSAKCTSTPLVLAAAMISCFSITVFTSQAILSSNFDHSFSRAALASGIRSASFMDTGVWTKAQ